MAGRREKEHMGRGSKHRLGKGKQQKLKGRGREGAARFSLCVDLGGGGVAFQGFYSPTE